jgi:histidine triad (HIT) family protein
MASIFTKIIRGEIPSHSVYEDEHAFAFLDINPRQPGHTLVVAKTEVDHLFDLDPAAHAGLWQAARTVARGLKEATRCERVIVIVLGHEVPHAHIHLIPSNAPGEFPFPPVVSQTQDEMVAMAAAIRSELGD